MKIPESIRIGGCEYRIDTVDNLNDGQHVLMGQIDYIKHQIHLSGSLEMDETQQALTLWHEIMHGIREANGYDLADEERVVEMFARGVYQVLADNAGRLGLVAPAWETVKSTVSPAPAMVVENHDKCVSCGAPVPEGHAQCWACEHGFTPPAEECTGGTCPIDLGEGKKE